MKIKTINLPEKITKDKIIEQIENCLITQSEDNKSISSEISEENNKITVILPLVYKHFIGQTKTNFTKYKINLEIKTIYLCLDYRKAFLLINNRHLSNQCYLDGDSNIKYKNELALNISDNEFCLISSDPFATIIDNEAGSILDPDNEIKIYKKNGQQVITASNINRANFSLEKNEKTSSLNEIPTNYEITRVLNLTSFNKYVKKICTGLGNESKLYLYLDTTNGKYVNGTGTGADITKIEASLDANDNRPKYLSNGSIIKTLELAPMLIKTCDNTLTLNLNIPESFATNLTIPKRITTGIDNDQKIAHIIIFKDNHWTINNKQTNFDEFIDLEFYKVKVKKIDRCDI